MALSPNSDFLVYFDPEIAKYVSYCIKDDKSEIISGSLTKELYVQQYAVRSGSELQEGNLGIVGWVKGTRKIIVHGMYDLWELDLANKVIPRNITQRIGDNNHLIFGDLESKLLESNATWILTGFNMLTKDGELYSFNYKNGIIKFLFKSNTLFSGLPSSNNIALKKADKSNCYLVRLGNAQDLPNYFVTSNFKKFDTLSNNHPEKKINWITSGLATYKDKFKKECQAILYKPENFDSLKKYPVIFYYYIESANSLNFTLDLDPSNIGVNIPILVSNGYIVCRPNIYLDINKPGDGALTSVIAVADYLKKFNWIDSTKMGIIGHSRGGYETDYIVTHTNMFAAAISAAGISNLVEYYNARNASGGESNHIYVRTQMLMTQGMEDSPNIYNENSPILAVKNISTPLLLMHNEEDNTVSVSQSTELFVQLRSMQKPVWLLQYEGEHHTISKLKNQIDFQNKVKDFFDHYLKDQPMPQWMNNPIK
jgi:dipeptidyl aminopeptidase/acylaminoacyl peptidase